MCFILFVCFPNTCNEISGSLFPKRYCNAIPFQPFLIDDFVVCCLCGPCVVLTDKDHTVLHKRIINPFILICQFSWVTFFIFRRNNLKAVTTIGIWEGASGFQYQMVYFLLMWNRGLRRRGTFLIFYRTN